MYPNNGNNGHGVLDKVRTLLSDKAVELGEPVMLSGSSLNYTVFRVPATIGGEFDGRESGLIAKVVKDNRDVPKRLLDPFQIDREAVVLGVLGDSRLLPRLFGHDDEMIVEEDVGNLTLEQKLVEMYEKGEDIRDYVSASVRDLAELHLLLQRIKIEDARIFRELRNYTGKLVEYCRDISGIDVNDRDRTEIEQGFFDFERTMRDGIPDYVHSDLSPWHKLETTRGNVFIDFGRVSLAPKLFDVVDMIANPLVRPDVKEREEYIKYYFISRLEHRAGMIGLRLRVTEDSEGDAWDNVLKESFIIQLYRDFRAAAKSFRMERNFPREFSERVQRNRSHLYPSYRLWYLSDAGETLGYLAEGSRRFGLNRENLVALRSILTKYAPQINVEKAEIYGVDPRREDASGGLKIHHNPVKSNDIVSVRG